MEIESVIVGGGITGLSCAYYVGKAGGSSLLIEPSDFGGLAHTSIKDGFTLEKGPNVLVEKPDLTELIEDLRLSGEVVRRESPYRQAVWFEGRVVDVPRSPFALIGSPLVAARDKALLPVRALRSIPDLPSDESISRFVSRFVGASGAARLVQPVLRGIFGGKADDLSARSAFPDLWKAIAEGGNLVSYLKSRAAAGTRRIFVLKGGIRALVNRLKEQVSGCTAFVCGSVTDLRPVENGLEIRVSDGTIVRARKVFVTTSGPASAPFLRSSCPALAERLSVLEYAPIAVAHYCVPSAGGLPRDCFGVLFPAGATSSRLLGVMFNTSIFPHVAPAGKGLVTVSFGGAGCSDVLSLGDPELAVAGATELRERLGVRDVTVLSVHRWSRAIPQLPPGHHELLDLFDAAEYDVPGLFFSGVDRGGIGVPDRVRHARLAVERSRAATREVPGASFDDPAIVRL